MFSRTRWSAIGAAVAVTLAGGAALPSASATNTDGGGAGTVFVPIVPCRLFDTRVPETVGPRSTPLTASETYTQAVTGANGNCAVPAEATGVAMNVTAVGATATSFLTIWPADAAQPTASNLNMTPGAPPTPNKVDVKLSADGKVKLFNNGGTVDVLADVVGYYADHNHDDRYYTKAQVDAAIGASEGAGGGETVRDTYPASSLVLIGSGALVFNSGCAGSYMIVGNARLSINVPLGARLISVDVATLDGPGSSDIYGLNLSKWTLSATTNDVAFLDSSARGNGNTLIVHDVFTPPSEEIAEAGVSFDIQFNGLDNNTNAFCNAVVSYQMAD